MSKDRHNKKNTSARGHDDREYIPRLIFYYFIFVSSRGGGRVGSGVGQSVVFMMRELSFIEIIKIFIKIIENHKNSSKYKKSSKIFKNHQKSSKFIEIWMKSRKKNDFWPRCSVQLAGHSKRVIFQSFFLIFYNF